MLDSLNARDHDHYETREHSGLRGLFTLLACSALLVAMAYVAMSVLMTPDGWMSQATLTSFQGEEPMTLVATAERPR